MNNKTSVRLRHTPRSLNRLTAIHCNSREDQEDQEAQEDLGGPGGPGVHETIKTV